MTKAHPTMTGVDHAPAQKQQARTSPHAARTASEAAMTMRGCTRSAQTPPNNVNTRRATVVAVMAAAICPALPPATTIATGNATTWKASPSQLSTCPVSTAVMRVVIAPVSSMWDGR
nr:hypothetical protein [Dermacoccus sp. CCH2-D9]